MSLYDRAVDLGVKLEAAVAADANDHLLAQGQVLVQDLHLVASTVEAAAGLRSTLGITTEPPIDVKAVKHAIGAFRAGLSRHGFAAFQHAPASTLRDVAKQQRAVAERWALQAWRLKVRGSAPHAWEVPIDRLQGTTGQRQRAQNRLRILSKVQDINPLTEPVKLQTELGVSTLSDCVTAIRNVDAELLHALQEIASTRAAYAPAVQAALAKVDSESGLPLDELTDALLAELRAAGLDDQLIVRRA